MVVVRVSLRLIRRLPGQLFALLLALCAQISLAHTSEKVPTLSAWELLTPQLNIFHAVCLENRYDIMNGVVATLRAGGHTENPDWAMDRLKGEQGSVWLLHTEGDEKMLIVVAEARRGPVCELHAQSYEAAAVAADLQAYVAGQTGETLFIPRMDKTLSHGKHHSRELHYLFADKQVWSTGRWSLYLNMTDDPRQGTQLKVGIMNY